MLKLCKYAAALATMLDITDRLLNSHDAGTNLPAENHHDLRLFIQYRCFNFEFTGFSYLRFSFIILFIIFYHILYFNNKYWSELNQISCSLTINMPHVYEIKLSSEKQNSRPFR